MGVEIVAIGKGRKVAARRLKHKATRILQLLNQNRVELSLALVGDREIRKLNTRFRNKDQPTDVLSFPSGEAPPTGERLLGDVVISVERAERQAREGGKNLEAELETLLIHGILHLLAYDHERSAKEAKRMQRMEKKLRRTLCGEGS